MDIFLKKFENKYNTAPFCKIKLSDYKPAFEQTIQIARKEIDSIVSNQENPSFTNTIEALDFAGEALDRLS